LLRIDLADPAFEAGQRFPRGFAVRPVARDGHGSGATVAAFLVAILQLLLIDPAAALTFGSVDLKGMTGLGLVSPLSLAVSVLLGASLVAATAGALVVRRRAAATRQEVERLERMFDVLAEGIVLCAGMQVVTANAAFCQLLSIGPDEVQGLLINGFIPDADVINRILSDTDVQVETRLHARNDEVVDVEITARTVPHGGAQRRLLEIRDIRRHKQAEDRVSFLARRDPLTALPNREVFVSRLATAVERACATGQRCAVIWIDLDGFKEINDIHGHATGDDILRTVSEKLKFELAADAMISRLGGDEFVALCQDLRDAEEARLIAQQLRRLLNRPVDLGHMSVTLGASLGLAVCPDDATSADDLLKNADLALYHAKTTGKGKARRYTEALGAERQRHMVLTEQLHGAIENGEIKVYFQPLLTARDLRISGFEALSRWFHPEFGPVPPPEFVRLAEENGLITPLTDLVMRRAVEAMRVWPHDVRVSVNVSPLQINSDLVDRVRDIITANAIDPRRLELEVTEDVLIKDFDQTASMFARLRALGIQIGMDDFGAGYTSFGNLRRLNFDRIKIDRIFTTDLPHHRRSAAIVRSILVLARELELDVTVEGVETSEQFNFLRAEGCPEVQGFLFSEPRPLEAFADLNAVQLRAVEPPPERPATAAR
jgi:diguanylate cyclase (GGDEF)-like protein